MKNGSNAKNTEQKPETKPWFCWEASNQGE